MAKKSFKVSLPGSLYQKNNRWWWKVKLPGQTRLEAMGLKPKGARFATTDRAEAEEVALGIWESAIRSKVQAQAREKAREKAKVVAKEMAGVEAEAAQTVARLKTKIMDTVANAKAQCEDRLRQCNEALAQAQELANAESEGRKQAEAKLDEILGGMKKTGTCDCCGKADVPEDELSTIDSGHRLCADCFTSLRG